MSDKTIVKKNDKEDQQKSPDKSFEPTAISYGATFKELFDREDGEAILRLTKELPVHPMCVAVSVGHLGAIRKMVQAGADINATYKSAKDGTALHVATQQGRQDTIECLFKLGANVSATDGDGNTPFMMAMAGKKQSLKHFWKYRPRTHLKVQNKLGDTALHIAVKVATDSTHADTALTVLLECEELDINAADNKGNTALMKAVHKPNLVNALLKKDVDILRENEEMLTAVCLSVISNKTDTCTPLLIEKMSVEERKKYIARRIELLRTIPATAENANFFKTYLFCVITCMWRNELMHPHMEPASFIEPWLEKIVEFHKVPDGLCIHVPLASLALCLMDDSDHTVHRPAVDAFIHLEGHTMVLDLMPKYNNNAGVLSGLVLLLVPLSRFENGMKWLEKNYLTLMNAYEAFNKELEFNILHLEGLPAGLGESLATFTSALEKIQEERSEQACRELLEEESKEKTKKQKKKKEQSEKPKVSSNKPSGTISKPHNNGEKKTEEERGVIAEAGKPAAASAEMDEFVPVMTKKQMKRNRKHKKVSKALARESEFHDATSIQSARSTPSPHNVKNRSTILQSSVNSSPSSTASLSEGEKAITKLVSAEELSFVHPDVKHRSYSLEAVPSKVTMGQIQFLGDPLPEKEVQPWVPKAERNVMDDPMLRQAQDVPNPDNKRVPKAWMPKSQLEVIAEVPHPQDQQPWTPKFGQLLSDDSVLPQLPKGDTKSWKPKVEQMFQAEETSWKPKAEQITATITTPWTPKADQMVPTWTPKCEGMLHTDDQKSDTDKESSTVTQLPWSTSNLSHNAAVIAKHDNATTQLDFQPHKEESNSTGNESASSNDSFGEETSPSDFSNRQSPQHADNQVSIVETNSQESAEATRSSASSRQSCEDVTLYSSDGLSNDVASQHSSTDYYEVQDAASQGTDMYCSEQDFASGDIVVNNMKVDPDVSSPSAHDSESRSTFAGDHADNQLQEVPEMKNSLEESQACRLIDQEHLESIARLPSVGEEFARLTPDPDPWLDNDTSFLPLKPSQLEPSLNTFTQLLRQQRNMAPSGEMMYGYDLHWKPKQTVHNLKKQDPWKQNLPYQRAKATAAPADIPAERKRTEEQGVVNQVPPSQAARGDSVRVGNLGSDPYAQMNAYSRTILNLNTVDTASDKTKNTGQNNQSENAPNRNLKKPFVNSQQNISVIWGNRKDQAQGLNRKTYSQILAKPNEEAKVPVYVPPTVKADTMEKQSNTFEPAVNTNVNANAQPPNQEFIMQQQVAVSVAAKPVVPPQTFHKQRSPQSSQRQPNYVKEPLSFPGPKTSSPVNRPSSTESTTSVLENAARLPKNAVDMVPPPAQVENRGAAASVAADMKGKDSGGKNKKPECIVKVAAWSKWKPACDAFMKTQWMFKYRIDQIAVAKHPEHYIVGRGPNESIVMMGQMLNGSEVAVKRIPLGLALRRQANMLRLLEANISHKNVVPFLHFEMDTEHGYIVTELCEFNLRQHVFNLTSRGHMGPETGLHLCRELVQALDYLHARGIIHGKLKPENVLIDMLGRIRLADYGIAISVNGSPMKYDTAASLWHTGEPIGYKADVQTCGMLMYFILSGGDHPYGNSEEEIAAHLSKSRPKTLQRTTDEADDLLKTLLFYPQALRPPTKKILRHPYFLDSSKRQELILAVWNELCEKRVETYVHLYTDLSRDDLYPQARGWMAHIKDGVLHKVLEEVIVLRQGQVFSDNLLGLLEFIDNVTVCVQSFLSPGLQKELGDPAPRFSGLFPTLPLYLYRMTRAIIMRINMNFLDYYF